MKRVLLDQSAAEPEPVLVARRCRHHRPPRVHHEHRPAHAGGAGAARGGDHHRRRGSRTGRRSTATGTWSAVTGYLTQMRRMCEIADEFRRRGRLVAIGGPYASLSPHVVRPHADILFIGEAEAPGPLSSTTSSAATGRRSTARPSWSICRPRPCPRICTRSRPAATSSAWCRPVAAVRSSASSATSSSISVASSATRRRRGSSTSWSSCTRRATARCSCPTTTSPPIASAPPRSCSPCATGTSAARAGRLYTQLSIDVTRDRDLPLLDLCAEAGLQAGVRRHRDAKRRRVARGQEAPEPALGPGRRRPSHPEPRHHGPGGHDHRLRLGHAGHVRPPVRLPAGSGHSDGPAGDAERPRRDATAASPGRLKIAQTDLLADAALDTNVIPKQMTSRSCSGHRLAAEQAVRAAQIPPAPGRLRRSTAGRRACTPRSPADAAFWERVGDVLRGARVRAARRADRGRQTLPRARHARPAHRAGVLSQRRRRAAALGGLGSAPARPARSLTFGRSRESSAAEIESWLLERLQARLGAGAEEIDSHLPFSYYGLDSIDAVALAAQLEEWLGVPVTADVAWDYPTVSAVAAHLGTDDRPAVDYSDTADTTFAALLLELEAGDAAN